MKGFPYKILLLSMVFIAFTAPADAVTTSDVYKLTGAGEAGVNGIYS